MKILFHCVYFPPEVGGLESHVYELARGLVDEGHEVRVVTSRSLPGVAREEVVEGIQVIRTWFPSRGPVGWTTHALASIPVTRRGARWADIVHAQAFSSVVPAGLAARNARRPLVITLHTSHFLTRAQRPGWRPILRRLVHMGDHVLAASTEIAEVGTGLTGGTVGVEPLTNGVDTSRFRPVSPAIAAPPGVRRLIVPRRLFPKNGVEFLVRAVPEIRRAIPRIEVLVVGDGPERGRLDSIARELGVEDQIRFLGSRPHGEMPGLLCSAELAVIPSLMEATSVAGLEAMACGLPLVASRVGGLPEIVGDDTGVLVPPADPPALADAICALLSDPDLKARGERARDAVVQHWSNARLVARHLDIYEQLLQPGHALRASRSRTSRESA
ncbi:MAG: glycosyltransferase family 1 protein [Gemmatimonadales bacterium]|nr:MAG: glycosyltransferase family 1 protein [Gemmatimonadales bacterium]